MVEVRATCCIPSPLDLSFLVGGMGREGESWVYKDEFILLLKPDNYVIKCFVFTHMYLFLHSFPVVPGRV